MSKRKEKQQKRERIKGREVEKRGTTVTGARQKKGGEIKQQRKRGERRIRKRRNMKMAEGKQRKKEKTRK